MYDFYRFRIGKMNNILFRSLYSYDLIKTFKNINQSLQI